MGAQVIAPDRAMVPSLVDRTRTLKKRRGNLSASFTIHYGVDRIRNWRVQPREECTGASGPEPEIPPVQARLVLQMAQTQCCGWSIKENQETGNESLPPLHETCRWDSQQARKSSLCQPSPVIRVGWQFGSSSAYVHNVVSTYSV